MVIRRLIAALAALLLAGAGAVLLLSYVGTADLRAMAGMETVRVLVVEKRVAEGTPAEKLNGLVTAKTLPVKAVAPGTLSSLEPIRGRVTTTDLQPGEQLLASRFIDPALLVDPNEVKIPKGMQQVSIALESQRVLGGELKPGSTVGVFISLAKEDERPAQTNLALHKVLVSKVQHGAASAQPDEGAQPENSAGLPEGSLMVTLAVTAPNAEKLVFGAEHGKIWLSLEPASAAVAGTRVVTEKSVYR
jgi:pilus assembly protein CpaB